MRYRLLTPLAGRFAGCLAGSPARVRCALGCLGILIAIKAVLLAIDPTIRLYLGDSVAYLGGALRDDWLPRDRSFIYSFVIRALVPLEQLWALLIWQACAGLAVAWLLWLTLVQRLAVSWLWAALAACALALEPAQLWYERMVMAETLGLLAFVGFFAAASAYLASGRLRWLLTIVIVGLLAASLRLNYLPIVLVVSLVLPLLRRFDRNRPAWRTMLGHAMVIVCAMTVTHTAYRQWVALMFDVPPSYMARSGFMQLGLVTPLIEPGHFERVGLPADFGQRLEYSLADPDARTAHMWAPGGLVRQLVRHKLDVERVARELSRMAIAENPFGLVWLGLHTAGDYFRGDRVTIALHNDLGRRAIPDEVLWGLRHHWGYDARGLPERITLVSQYFGAATWWLVACLCLLLPLSAANLIVQWHTPERTQVLLLALISLGLIAAHVLFVNVAFYRYLHPLPFFTIATAVSLAHRLRPMRRAR